MEFASAEAQKLIRDTALADPVFGSMIEGFYDDVPSNPGWPNAVFGAYESETDDADCVDGVIGTQTIDIWSRDGGSVQNKRLCEAFKKSIHEKDLEIADNALVSIRVPRWRTFADPDGLTEHGVVTVELLLEEN